MTRYEICRNEAVSALLDRLDTEQIRELAHATLARKFDGYAKRHVSRGATQLANVIAEAELECRRINVRARWFDHLE